MTTSLISWRSQEDTLEGVDEVCEFVLEDIECCQQGPSLAAQVKIVFEIVANDLNFVEKDILENEIDAKETEFKNLLYLL